MELSVNYVNSSPEISSQFEKKTFEHWNLAEFDPIVLKYRSISKKSNLYITNWLNLVEFDGIVGKLR